MEQCFTTITGKMKSKKSKTTIIRRKPESGQTAIFAKPRRKFDEEQDS